MQVMHKRSLPMIFQENITNKSRLDGRGYFYLPNDTTFTVVFVYKEK